MTNCFAPRQKRLGELMRVVREGSPLTQESLFSKPDKQKEEPIKCTRPFLLRAASALLIRAVMLVLLPLGFALTVPIALEAQGVSFAGVQSTVGSGFIFPAGVAVDGAGNVFVADIFFRRVVKVSLNGTQTTVSSKETGAVGVAVDRAGDVFISDHNNNQVVKVPADGGAQTTVVGGLNGPTGLAVDGAGDLFVDDSINNRVLEVPAGGGAQIALGSGLYIPQGVGIDGAGNVFIADTGNNRVVEVPAGGGAQIMVGSGLVEPFGVVVDAAGNIYISDTFQAQVVKIPAGGGAQTTVGSGLVGPKGLALNGGGDLFIADYTSGHVVKMQLTAANFGTANICPSGQSSPAPCSQTLALTYDVVTSGTLAAAPTVLTQGAPNLDFTLAGGSTCSGDVTAGSQCTVNVTFTPRAPGLRMGAVEITDTSGNILATTAVHGVGQGPAIAFGPATLSTVVGGLSGPTNAVAVDAAGNLFFTDTNKARVVKVQAGSGAQTAVVTGLNAPQGLAVDGAGDIFVADTGNSRVVKAPAGGGALTTVGSGLSFPQGVAVDGAGNVFIADGGNARLVEVPAGGGPQTTLFTGLNNPYEVAVDAAGNIFIGDDGNNRVVKLPADGGAQTTVGTGLSHPRGVAVDGAGDVFIGDDGNNRVLGVPAGGGAQTTLSSDLFHPAGVAVDGAGNVFTGDLFSRIAELQRSQAPGLTFAATSVGSTSSDSPQSVTIQNIGTAALTETALTVGANFQQVPGSGTPGDCTSNFTLAPGESCNLSFSFTPQTHGNLQSSAVLTNNALNATAAMQSIILRGTGIAATTTTASAAAGQYSDAVTLSAFVGPSGLTFSGTVQFQVAGVNACTASVTGSGTYTCSYTITQPAGTYAITATLTSTDSSALGSSGNNTLTVTKENATVTPSNTNPSTVRVNAAGGTAGPITLRGTAQQAQDGSLGDITKAVVTVNLLPAASGGPTIVCPVSNTNGALTTTCSNLPVDAYTVQWSIGGTYYQAPTVNSVLAVYDPSLGFVTGSGSVNDTGIAANFAISVKYLKNGTLTGGVTYIEHRASGDVTVSSTTLSSMSLVGTTAIIHGQARVNGVAGYTLQVNVTDNGTPGINRDRFGLQLSGGTLTRKSHK